MAKQKEYGNVFEALDKAMKSRKMKLLVARINGKWTLVPAKKGGRK